MGSSSSVLLQVCAAACCCTAPFEYQPWRDALHLCTPSLPPPFDNLPGKKAKSRFLRPAPWGYIAAWVEVMREMAYFPARVGRTGRS